MLYEIGFKPSALREIRKLDEVQDRKLIVTVVKVAHRRDVYR